MREATKAFSPNIRTFFVITAQDEHGPLDRAALVDLLRQGRITADDRVRTASGRPLGRVAEVLGDEAGIPQDADDEQPAAAVPRRSARKPAPPFIAIGVVAGGVLLLGALLLMRLGGPSAPVSPSPAAQPVASQPTATPSAGSGGPHVASPDDDGDRLSIPGRAAQRNALASDLLPGLLSEVFPLGALGGDGMPSMVGLTPLFRGVDQCIDVASENAWPGTTLATNFMVRWTGILHVADAGLCNLSIDSDDGSRLLVDGQVVVDNSGPHPPQERNASVMLNAGDHPITLEFFQGEGGYACHLAAKMAGAETQILDGRQLFHRRDPQVDPPAH